MLMPPTVKVYVCVTPVDFRKQHDGLCACVRGVMQLDPMSGYLFVFTNKRRTGLKIVFWDRSGFALFYKKLARGTFKIPRDVNEGATSVEVEGAELALMLEGIDLNGAARRKRWDPDENLPSMRLPRDGDPEQC